jgi:hypothetical protein
LDKIGGVKIYILGTAGSGKTVLTHSLQIWMQDMGLEVATVNLDPGEKNLPYDPEVDIRDWINLYDVMDHFGLGPNGAQILCADELALKADEVKRSLDEFDSDFVLVDTPGQMELFAYRESGRILIDALGPENSILAFLLDPVMSRTPGGFVSLQMLSLSVQFRFSLPQVNIISKSDTLKEETIEKIMGWNTEPESLYDELILEKGILKEMNLEFLRALEIIGMQGSMIAVSSEEYSGMEDIYNLAVQIFGGGEDLRGD